jgi:endonuclease-8
VPEGDTIFRAARTLKAALAGRTVTRFETVLPYLARVHHDTPITGRVIEDVVSHGKWIEMRLSGDLILLTHMLMSGSWHIYRPGEKWARRHDDMRIVIGADSFEAVAFKVPVAEFHTAASLLRRSGFNRLGNDLLAKEFDEKEAAEQLRARSDLEVGEALLDQSLLAGIGNVFKSEIAFVCGVNPFRPISSLSEEEISCLVSTARNLLKANVSANSSNRIVTYTGFRRTTGRQNTSERLWVYQRNGEPCRKCDAPIRSRKQGPAARVTFWCPNCQP